jgi:hypothetical protein
VRLARGRINRTVAWRPPRESFTRPKCTEVPHGMDYELGEEPAKPTDTKQNDKRILTQRVFQWLCSAMALTRVCRRAHRTCSVSAWSSTRCVWVGGPAPLQSH